mmetsp:Transcript_28077/g.24804  ORF Transcript_28077/g.24804 Transcript_28077/m.24804 type:complete len:152 (-) Transcript_28077:92-547(-)
MPRDKCSSSIKYSSEYSQSESRIKKRKRKFKFMHMNYSKPNLRNDVVIKTFSRGILRELETSQIDFILTLGLTNVEANVLETRIKAFRIICRKKFSLGQLSILLKCNIFQNFIRQFLSSKRVDWIINNNKIMRLNHLAYEEAAKLLIQGEY